MKAQAKGARYEWKTKKILEKEGFYVTRSAGSHGSIDLVVINSKQIRLIQVKSGKSPFLKAEREAFEALKVPINCSKEVWVWKAWKKPQIRIWEGERWAYIL